MRKAEQDRLREVEAEQAYFMRAWHRFHADELDKALAGPHGAVFAQLMALLKNLGKITPDHLVAFVRSTNWGVVPYELRLIALHEVNQAIIRYRVRHNLSPLDDGAPGDPNNTFRRIRRILTVFPYENGGLTGADAGSENKADRKVYSNE